MGIIKFLLWTMPFGGIVTLLNPKVMTMIAHGSDEMSPGCVGVFAKILLTGAFWCGVYLLFFAK